jgi:hypothetical protein
MCCVRHEALSRTVKEATAEAVSDPLLAPGGLDRLTHRAHIGVITGASFRAQVPTWEAPIGVAK